MNIFVWHVHGSWMTAFVQGDHRYFVPVDGQRSVWGRGRARTWQWPESVVEVDADTAADLPIDLVVLQRPQELHLLAARWLGGRPPGLDLPAVYVEHDPPQGPVEGMLHPVAAHPGVVLAHVTAFNRTLWDSGDARTVVIEHGIVDPGYRYTGELARSVAVINEPLRRRRVMGTDLLAAFERVGPLDLFGAGAESVDGLGELTQDALHEAMSARRVYVHTPRWTSLGLSLTPIVHVVGVG